MNVLVLQIFVSLMLVAGAIAMFVWTVRSRTFEHAERLALAPLEDDTNHNHAGSPAVPAEEESA